MPSLVTPPLSAPTAERTLELERIANELKWKVSGEVRFDATARALYSTDASPYEIRPYGVVLPKTVGDVSVVLEVARRHGLAVLPRGGGTSLAGQTVAEAIVIDFSKYMDAVLDFNPEEGWVKVQPGVVRDNLNAFLAPYRLQFTPDIATSSRACVGGMVANNSSGTRSVRYGKTVDQVIAMTVMLYDGTVAELKDVGEADLEAALAQEGPLGDLCRTVHSVVSEHEAEIEARFPKVMRRVGGYNLDEFIGGKPFNLAKLVCGSEGTLAVILEVTLRLHPVPKARLLALLHFDSLVKSLEAVRHINHHGPTAVEIMDETLLALGHENPHLEPLLSWQQGQPKAVLVVEFDGDSEDEMNGKLASMEQDADIAALAYACPVARSPQGQAEVWEFRKGGLGIFATMKGDAKPTPFIEDAAVPVEHLPHYIPEVVALCASYGVKTVMYAHASVGVLHVRPVLDLKTQEGVDLYAAISQGAFELVQKYGGSWSGEHGDGLIRSYQNKALFGEVVYEDFLRIKRAFDPLSIMNPGKIVGAPPMTESLRYGAGYRLEPVNTFFDFSRDGGFGAAVELCSGVGHCRKTLSGTMCPSYMATRDEDHSTRGRANVLREALSGGLPGGLTSKEVYGALDLCLECKACKAECPSQVDMAKLKYEFLAHYHAAHGTPLGVRAMGGVAATAPVGRLLAPIANAVLPTKPVRWAIEKAIGVDRRRVMPLYANASFAQTFRQRPERAEGGNRPVVALFADTWTMFHDPHIGTAAVNVLEALGYRALLIPYGCCGRPQISKGLLKEAKRTAQARVRALYPYVQRGVPVVGLEPSCVTAFQDDYPDLIPGEKTKAVAGHVKMIDQFLAKAWSSGKLDPAGVFTKNGAKDGAKEGRAIMFHGHCQQKAVIGSRPSTSVLGWISDDVREIDSGCCGMAGSFGYSHYDLSMAIGERRLFPGVRAHGGTVVACGFSCRHQIRDGTGKGSRHLVEVMAEALTPSESAR
jgi:FAD/FMN-containing dehydrogenase/Fe-S oxidoreductase